MFSCTEKFEKQISDLSKTRDSLQTIVKEREDLLAANELIIKEIQATLDTIAGKEQILSDNVENAQIKDKILSEINKLQGKIDQYKKQYQSNLGRISGMKSEISQLKRTVVDLNNEITNKNTEIQNLKTENGQLKDKTIKQAQSLDSMAKVVKQRESVIQDKEAEMRIAYYVIGTKKDLVAKGILNKNGKQLNGKPDSKLFTQIDYSKNTSFPIQAKQAILITPHNKDSYEFFSASATKTDSFHIVKPKDFWSASKYLVIVVK